MTDQFDGDIPPWLTDDDDNAESGGDFESWLNDAPSEEWVDPPTTPLPKSVLQQAAAGGDDQPDAPEVSEDADDSEPIANATGDLPDWLNMPTSDYEAAILESAAELAGDSEPEGDDDVPDWAADDTDAAEEESYADWAQENMPEENIDAPDWMSKDISDFAEASAAGSELTYEEWERQQDEAEYEETREPDLPVPEFELPDLTADIDTGRPSTGDLAETQNYMPDWFMGVEELKDDDAPDWLKGTDLETGQFDNRAIDTSEDLPAPASPLQATDDLLPDFDTLMGGDIPLPDLGEPPEPPKAPAIRRLDTSEHAPVRESDALSIDDILLGDDDAPQPSEPDEFSTLFGDDAPSPSDFVEADVAQPSPQDEFAALFGDDSEMPAPPELPEPDALPMMDDEVDFDEDQEPDWLQTYDADAEHAALDAEKSDALDYTQAESAPQEMPETGMLPDWFGDVDFDAAQAAEEADEYPDDDISAAEEIEEKEAFDLDDLLGSDLGLPAQKLSPSGTLVDDVDDLASAEDLGFDDDMFAQFAAPAPSQGLPAEDAPELERAQIDSTGAVPDWVQQMGMSGDEVVLNLGGVEEHFEQVPPVVLPNELRTLRDDMAEHIDRASHRTQIDQGPLAGVDDALDIDAALTEPGQLSLSRTARDLSDSQQMRLNALEGVLQAVDQETEAERIEIRYDLGGEEYEVEGAPVGAPEPRREHRRAKRRPDRLLVMLALLIFAVVPFATEELHLAEDPPTELDDDAMPLADAINELSDAESEASKRVLVAVEYGPSTARELDPLLEAVLRDIMAHGGTPVVTSTNPLGLLHVSHMLESLATDETLLSAIQPPSPPGLPAEAPEGIDQFTWNAIVNQYVPPEPETTSIEYVVLRYLPAGAVGVRSLTTSETSTGAVFTRDFYGEDTNLEIGELDNEDFAFIVVAGDRYDDARIWAEQTNTLDLDKFALVTAAAEPITRAYVSAGEYKGMLSGFRGALMYDAVRDPGRLLAYEPPEGLDIPNPTLSRWHSAALGAMAAAAVIGLGALFNIARMMRRRREQYS